MAERYWPLAIRQAAEELGRSQLRAMGVPVQKPLEFGQRVMIKKKTWHRRGVAWAYPMVPARAFGPASDMSWTSGGYFLRTEDGLWLRSTTVVSPKWWREDQVKAEAVGTLAGGGEPCRGEDGDAGRKQEAPQKHRVHGKSAEHMLYGKTTAEGWSAEEEVVADAEDGNRPHCAT